MDLAFLIARVTFLSTFAACWLAPALWVLSDARARGSRLGWLGLLPGLGAGAWLVLRPHESLADRRLRRARTRVLEASLGERCLVCRTPVEPEFRCCPGCGEAIRRACGCGGLLEPHWIACPWCLEPADEPQPIATAVRASAA